MTIGLLVVLEGLVSWSASAHTDLEVNLGPPAQHKKGVQPAPTSVSNNHKDTLWLFVQTAVALLANTIKKHPSAVLDISTFKARGHIVPRSLTVTELDCLQCTCAWCLTGVD